MIQSVTGIQPVAASSLSPDEMPFIYYSPPRELTTTEIEDVIDKSEDELLKIEGMTQEMAQQLLGTLSENIEVVEEEFVKTENAPAETGDEEEEYYECPNCGSRITEEMSRCESCGVELIFKDEDEDEEIDEEGTQEEEEAGEKTETS